VNLTDGTALVALGANLGDARDTLARARTELSRLGSVTRHSRLYRTAPVGGPPDQPDYLNAALMIVTPLAPLDLLRALLEIERGAGRERRERWGPRTLDLDLLAYGDRQTDDAELTLPHPRLTERAFVLAPLADVAPDWVPPGGLLSVREMLASADRSGIQVLRDAW